MDTNGLDFDQPGLNPWRNDPAFDVTVFSEESERRRAHLRAVPSPMGTIQQEPHYEDCTGTDHEKDQDSRRHWTRRLTVWSPTT